jgi:hypothetical protein
LRTEDVHQGYRAATTPESYAPTIDPCSLGRPWTKYSDGYGCEIRPERNLETRLRRIVGKTVLDEGEGLVPCAIIQIKE